MNKAKNQLPMHGRRIILQGGYVFEVQHQHAEHLDVLQHRLDAYPKLVRELRVHNLDQNGEQKQNTAIAVLLRELGEIQ